eukprot:COSAG03_NODE_22222_length_293_cov_29.680412_1_plen_69_part_10
MGTNSPRIAFATQSVVTRLLSKFIRKNFSIILTLSIEIPIIPLAGHIQQGIVRNRTQQSQRLSVATVES